MHILRLCKTSDSDNLSLSVSSVVYGWCYFTRLLLCLICSSRHVYCSVYRHLYVSRCCVGRISEQESLFYYGDGANGLDFDFFNSQGSYSPVFDIQPTDEQRQEAEQLCTVGDEFSESCAYDLYATNNRATARGSASSQTTFSAAASRLGMFIILLLSSRCYWR